MVKKSPAVERTLDSLMPIDKGDPVPSRNKLFYQDGLANPQRNPVRKPSTQAVMTKSNSSSNITSQAVVAASIQ